MPNNNEEMEEIKKLVNQVQNYAEKHKYAYLIPEQMLYILLSDEKCVSLIKQLTTDKNKSKTISDLKKDVGDYIEGNVEKSKDISNITPTNSYAKLIRDAVSQGAMRSMEPDSLCVFIMLFNDKEQASSYFLSKHGIYEDDAQEYVRKIRSKSSTAGTASGFVSKYAVDLTALAKDGKIDPLIGRTKEIDRVAQILARKKSSNVCLCSDPGCGKTAIVEGIALKIVNDDVPKSLSGKTIYALDLASMVAGTKFRGEFEERLENTIKECANDENIILFIDELHTIVGAGSSEGSMDSANILKPYLSRGQLKIIGATTYDEYKNKIEKDKALCRRFKKIDVSEPSKDDTLKILQGLRSKYEEYHGVKFSDDVLKYAVDLSAKYVIGKYFPDKAIDIVDEIGAKYHSGIKDGTEATKDDVEEVVCSIANIPKISVETSEKERLRTLGDRIKGNLFGQDDIVDKIVRQVKMNKAGLSNVGKPIMSALLLGPTGCITGDTYIDVRKKYNGHTPVKTVIDGERNAVPVSGCFQYASSVEISGKKSMKATVDEFRNMLETDDGVYEIITPDGWIEVNEFYDRGERESVFIKTESHELKCSCDHLVMDSDGNWVKAESLHEGSIIRTANGMECVKSTERLGRMHVYDLWVNSAEHAYYSNGIISHNCGKTELAKTLANELGIGFTKLDMSEYQEEYSVSKLIGSAAGYVGYEQSGALTEPLIKNPHQVILLDEIEKANKSVYDLLLQVLDEGKLTDNHGREASFKNAIILMTTNVGYANASAMSNSLGFTKTDADDEKKTRKAIEDSYKKKFSPEFRNRLTNAFYFNNISNAIMGMIVDKNIRNLQKSLDDKGVVISLSDNAKSYIVKKAVDEKAGGRPVERIVNSEITEKIADEILFGSLSEKGGRISVDEKDDALVLEFITE